MRSDGSTVIPTCALRFPSDERDEAQTVNLIGDFGDAASGRTPVAIRVVGALRGKPPRIYRGDRNRCTLGRTFVRVMWSNGLTAYPTGEEVGAAVVASYRAVYRRPDGRLVALAPLEVADRHDHASSFNADNTHDLCLPRAPRGATLTRVAIGAGLIQDPDGDPNLAPRFSPT